MVVEVDLTGRTAIVTGTARGIGRRTAERLAESGANIVGVDIDEAENVASIEAIDEAGADSVAVTADISDPSDVERVVDTTLEEFGSVDVLVNVAAINPSGDVMDRSAEDIERILAINLVGPALLAREVANAMRESSTEHGRIINLSSVAADVGIPSMGIYGASKSAVESLTKALAAEVAPDGITVNAVSPGIISTKRVQGLLEDEPEMYDLDRVPMNRLGDPGEVADIVLFLASDLSSYVTGSVVDVDGGVSFTAGHLR